MSIMEQFNFDVGDMIHDTHMNDLYILVERKNITDISHWMMLCLTDNLVYSTTLLYLNHQVGHGVWKWV